MRLLTVSGLDCVGLTSSVWSIGRIMGLLASAREEGGYLWVYKNQHAVVWGRWKGRGWLKKVLIWPSPSSTWSRRHDVGGFTSKFSQHPQRDWCSSAAEVVTCSAQERRWERD